MARQLLSVETVVSHLLWHISWWTAHVVATPAVSTIFTEHYPTCLVMIGVASLNVLAFISAIGLSTSI
jgi:hypothetical protein